MFHDIERYVSDHCGMCIADLSKRALHSIKRALSSVYELQSIALRKFTFQKHRLKIAAHVLHWTVT